MAPCPWSTRNVNDALEFLAVIQSTHFYLQDASWSFRKYLHTDHHPGRIGIGSWYLYYGPFSPRNISMEIVRDFLEEARVVSPNAPTVTCPDMKEYVRRRLSG